MKRVRWKSVAAFLLALMVAITAVPTTQVKANDTLSGNSVSENGTETDGQKENQSSVSGNGTEKDGQAGGNNEGLIENQVNEEGTENQSDGVSTENTKNLYGVVLTSESDFNAPVVESFTLEEAGQELTVGDEFHIIVTGYDAEGGEIKGARLWLKMKETGESHNTYATNTENLGNNQYRITYKVDSSWAYEGEVEIEYFGVQDAATNEKEVKADKCIGSYSFILKEAVNDTIKISEIKLSKNIIELTDEVLEDSIELELIFEDGKAPANTSEYFTLWFRHDTEDGSSYSSGSSIQYDSTQNVWRDTIRESHGSDVAGTYTLEKIYFEGKIIEFTGSVSYTVKATHSDIQGPEVESVELYYDGKKLEAGAVLEKKGTLQVRAKVTDQSELESVYVKMDQFLSNVTDDIWTSMTYDGSLGCYVYDVDLSQLYATEWAVSYISASDIYDNQVGYSGSYNYDSLYFYLKDTTGNIAIPEFTYDVVFRMEDGSENRYSVTTGRVTSLKEMFPDGIPYNPQKEGLTFEGWVVYMNPDYKGPLQETDMFAVDGDEIEIIPSYNKLLLELSVKYYSQDGEYKNVTENIIVDKDTTYGELCELELLSEYVHSDKLTFIEWQLNSSYNLRADEVISLSNTYVEVKAVYNKLPVSVSYNYYDESGNYHYFDEVVICENGITYESLMAELGLDKIVHSKEFGFTGWDMGSGLDISAVIDSDYFYLYPQYEKSILDFYYYYYDKNNEYVNVEKGVIYEDDDTYRDIIEKYLVSDEVHAPGFSGWEYYHSGSSLDDIIGKKEYSGQSKYIRCYPDYSGDSDNNEDSGNSGGSDNTGDNENSGDSGNTGDNGNSGNSGNTEDSGNSGGSGNTGDWGYEEDDYSSGSDSSTETNTAVKPEETKNEQEVKTEIPTLTPQINTAEKKEFPTLSEEETAEKGAVKLEDEVIAKKAEEVQKAEDGSTFVIEMTKEDGEVATEVPVAVLEAVRGKDVNIVLDMGGYSWTINGKDILSSDLSAINLKVTMDTEAVAPSIVEKLAGGEPARQISLTHNGDFGFKASLTINVGSEHEGEFGNLYYHDSNGKLVFMNAGQIDEEGNVSLDFSHASDYVVVIGRDRTAEEMESETTQETLPPEIIEEEVVMVEEPVKESGNGMIPIIVVLIVVAAAVGIVLVKKNKK